MSDDPESADASVRVSKVRCPHCGAAHPTAWSHCPSTGRSIGTGEALVGRVIAERYRVLGVLAEGGMGMVYEAEHALMGRRVAIKRLHSHLAPDRSNIERFQREARAAAAIGHENIVEVVDMGFAEDGAPYLVMEYLTGETLATVLRREGPLAPARACDVLGQVLSALDAVHAAGIVHRDLKPDNVLLSHKNGRADFVKVLDFGISKIRTEGDGDALRLTGTGATVGTPHYMSPEQARGSRVRDHRVDIYATGVMLYETLTGALPFDGPNYHALLQAIVNGVAAPILSIAPSVPPGVVAIVEQAMARAPDERFGSAAEMREALRPFGVATSAPEAQLDAAPGGRPFGPTSPLAPPGRPRRSAGASRSPDSASSAAKRPEKASSTRRNAPVDRVEQAAEAPASTSRNGEAEPPEELRVPQPRAFSPTPHAFEAASADWTDAPPQGLLVRASTGGAASRSRSRLALEHDAADEGPPDGPKVAGVLVGLAVYHLRESFGISGLEAVLSAAPPETAARLRGALMTVPWVPAALIVDLATAAQATLGRDGGPVAVDLGRGVAGRALGTSHRHLVQGLSPTEAVRALPKIWEAFHEGGELIVRRTRVGAFNVQVSGHAPPVLAHASFMVGFYLGLLERVGVRDPHAQILACVELGAARTVTELRFQE